MPTRTQDPAVLKAMGLYWPAIQAAANRHVTTAELWDAIRSAAADQGLDRPGVSLTAVNTLRAAATRMARSAEALNTAARDSGFEGLIGQAPWSAPLDVQAAAPSYLIGMQLGGTIDGEDASRYVTVRWSGPLPASVGDLLDSLDTDAALMAGDYNTEYTGISGLSITAA